MPWCRLQNGDLRPHLSLESFCCMPPGLLPLACGPLALVEGKQLISNHLCVFLESSITVTRGFA